MPAEAELLDQMDQDCKALLYIRRQGKKFIQEFKNKK